MRGEQLRTPEFTWLIWYADDGILTTRTFQTKEAAEAFIRRICHAPNQEFRSWAEVWTRELPRPGDDE